MEIGDLKGTQFLVISSTTRKYNFKFRPKFEYNLSTSRHFTSPPPPTLSASLHATSLLPFCLPRFTPLHLASNSLHITSTHFTPLHFASRSFYITSPHFMPLHFTYSFFSLPHFMPLHVSSDFFSLTSPHFTSLHLPFVHLTSLHFVPLCLTSRFVCLTACHFAILHDESCYFCLTSRQFTASCSLRITSRHSTSPPILFSSLHLILCHFASPPLPFPCLTSCHFTSPPVLSASLHSTSCHFASPPVVCLTSRHFMPLHAASHYFYLTSHHVISPPILSASLHATSLRLQFFLPHFMPLHSTSPPFFSPHFASPHLISSVRLSC